jgi:hypothetical protein
MLLSTATGQRRLLAERIAAHLAPSWSADGRRVRFAQRVPRHGFGVPRSVAS